MTYKFQISPLDEHARCVKTQAAIAAPKHRESPTLVKHWNKNVRALIKQRGPFLIDLLKYLYTFCCCGAQCSTVEYSARVCFPIEYKPGVFKASLNMHLLSEHVLIVNSVILHFPSGETAVKRLPKTHMKNLLKYNMIAVASLGGPTSRTGLRWAHDEDGVHDEVKSSK